MCAMDRNQKTEIIGDVKDKFARMTSAVFLNYEGVDVASATKLRGEFQKVGVQYRVVKNTLVKLALQDTSYGESLASALTGMTGIAWSFEDPSAAAKVVVGLKKEIEKLKVKAGVIEGRVLDAKEVEEQLAKMPGKQELRAQLLATLQAPAQNLVGLLNAPAQNLVYALDAKRRQDNGEG